MNFVMAGLDYEHADIAQREKLSFVKGQAETVMKKLRTDARVHGCVLISTCNRTELYLTCEEDTDPVELLCTAAAVKLSDFRPVFCVRKGEEAVRHLFEVSCGLRSQILGEDQILTQVRQAAVMAREVQASDPILETLFRCAVTAGKEVKTETRLTAIPLSAAHQGVALAEKLLGGLSQKHAVVIGNGEMGRLASALLIDKGAFVTVTLRSYRHGETVVPRGCHTQPYENRLQVIDGCDFVVSATTSPHFTLTKEQIASLSKRPRLILDLALPRDVEPSASTLTDVRNMDDLGCLEPENLQDRKIVEQIIKKHMARFQEWYDYRASLPVIEQIKETVFDRIFIGEYDEDTVRDTVYKTVDLLLGSMKESLTPMQLEKAQQKLKSRQRKTALQSH